ncbi:hypothetical protein ACTJLC_25950 [Paraburkholderia sp. 22099]|uniref:hypothetical protein n=1 Tax=Paraburkholderia TaxID=1822464 RepID=UPI002854DC26|nr:hypothetical protein [Paraburkholderia terricola]MDR6491548.1 hypothetical protein [Paraburkholderia terricola]
MEHPLPDAPQRFVISHDAEADFKTGGLRDYSAYRDLGVGAATNGLVKAHVIRMIAPFRPELSVRHHSGRADAQSAMAGMAVVRWLSSIPSARATLPGTDRT